MALDKSKYVIDWVKFVETSIDHNWKIKGTLLKLEQSFLDYYDKDFSEVIMERLRELYES